jgi:NAD(P)-dependent dehydrogenase (short-subunit alcohol dehydrogenase family)
MTMGLVYMRMLGKSVFVTGGAGGIGRAVALRMAEEGAAVAVADRDADGGRQTVDLLAAKGHEAAEFYQLDVTDDRQWGRAADAALARFGRIDVLVNNAGLYLIRSLADTTVADWDLIMNVNAKGVFLGMRTLAPVIAAGGGGSIVNMSSTTALSGILGRTAYSASKAAVRVMSQSVAVEYAAAQVRVNAVFPGFIRTAIADQGAEAAGRPIDEIGWDVTPLGRIGEVEDVASMCLFLASDEARHVTGAEFVVDGGLTAGPNDPRHVNPLTGQQVPPPSQPEVSHDRRRITAHRRSLGSRQRRA